MLIYMTGKINDPMIDVNSLNCNSPAFLSDDTDH